MHRISSQLVLIFYCLLFVTFADASDKNINLRGNFDNSYDQFMVKKTGTVAFMGGSITQMDGYRPMVSKFLDRKFPRTKFKFINAGISSTCSTTGAFRLTDQVLGKGVIDLFFIEFYFIIFDKKIKRDYDESLNVCSCSKPTSFRI